MKEKMGKLDMIIIKKFCAKDTIKGEKALHGMGKIFENHMQ